MSSPLFQMSHSYVTIYSPYLNVLVLVGEEDDYGKAADDDALEDEQDGPQDPVEGDDARRSVSAALAARGTFEALEGLLQRVDTFLTLNGKR